MPLALADRLLTIVATATVTSAAWIVVGNVHLVPGYTGEGPTQAARETPRQTPAPMEVTQAEAERLGLLIPVEGVNRSDLRDTFQERRDGGTRAHEALDIAAPAGTPVISPAPGTIEKLFRSSAGGNTIYLRSLDLRTIYYFAHLAGYADGLKEGQSVRRGQELGTVGTTGNANPDAPHLHFAVLRTAPDAQWWEPARALNPYNLLVRQEGKT